MGFKQGDGAGSRGFKQVVGSRKQEAMEMGFQQKADSREQEFKTWGRKQGADRRGFKQEASNSMFGVT